METGVDKGGRARSHRSAVSNGLRRAPLSGEIDGRTSTARRFRDIVETVTADLGGKDLLSEGQRQLIRRASALSIMCESVEADLVRDMPFDVANYLTATNSLRRVLETLGIERKSRDVSPATVFRIRCKLNRGRTSSEPRLMPGRTRPCRMRRAGPQKVTPCRTGKNKNPRAHRTPCMCDDTLDGDFLPFVTSL